MASMSRDIGGRVQGSEERNNAQRAEGSLGAALAGAARLTVSALSAPGLVDVFGRGQGWAGIVKEATK